MIKLHFRNDNQEIWISDVTKVNQGTYTCTATNDFGQQSAKAYVTILGIESDIFDLIRKKGYILPNLVNNCNTKLIDMTI